MLSGLYMPIRLQHSHKIKFMFFETLEHVLNLCLVLKELSRVARKKVYVSIPGVQETLVHPRIKGSRLGEHHIVEFCERDFHSLLSHLPLRVSFYERIEVSAASRGFLAWITYQQHSTKHLFGGHFKFFQFYEMELSDEGLGLDEAAYHHPYGIIYPPRQANR